MYGPFRDGEDPRLGIFPTYDELAEDVNILASVTDLIGMYSTDHGFSDVIALGGAAGLRVIPGCFLDNGSNDDAEVNSLIDTLNLYPDTNNIPLAMVGSEAVSLQGVAVGDLIVRINQVRDGTANRVPIGTAEYWGTWLASPDLAAAVDVIMVNVYPYYEGYAIEQATDYTIQRLREVQEKYPGQMVLIGETGWPSEGEAYGPAIPSLANEEFYFSQLMSRSSTEGFGILYFEAFDENWKIDVTGAENQGHFGIFTSQREAKFPILNAQSQ